VHALGDGHAPTRGNGLADHYGGRPPHLRGVGRREDPRRTRSASQSECDVPIQQFAVTGGPAGDMISLQSIAGGKRAVLLLLVFLAVALLLLPESRQESLMVLGRPMASVIAVPLRAMELANQKLVTTATRFLSLH